jgi:hypothetical protein
MQIDRKEVAIGMPNQSEGRLPSDAESLLHPPERALWRDYLSNSARGLRDRALQILKVFVSQVQAYPAQERQAWVDAWCRAYLDEETELSLRYPLFAHVIGPELRRGYEVGEPNYARWLARISQTGVVHPQRLAEMLGRPNISTQDLLRDALRVDPTDRRAARWLAKDMARAFEYYTHEVPLGVLADPASFRQELDEFERLVAGQGLADRYAVALRHWRFHCEGWADYLRRRSEFVNYADYLSRMRPRGEIL